MPNADKAKNAVKNKREKEHRVYGVPGAGKTTWLVRRISELSRENGEDDIFVSSFSKAAAVEILDRAGIKKSGSAGTLHSICYNALPSLPGIAETRLADWNAEHPGCILSSKGESAIDTGETAAWGETGNSLLLQMNAIRARGIESAEAMKTPEGRKGLRGMTHGLDAFAGQWESWKAANGLMDFTDLLVQGHAMESAPGEPRIGFFDEAQDFNPLMLDVVRKWGAKMEHYILAGDDDQTIYSFMGSTPGAFISGECRQEVFLTKSWRCAAKVADFANGLSRRVSERREKAISPAPGEGEVMDFSGNAAMNAANGEAVLKLVQGEIREGRRVMLLAPCAYMLNTALAAMRGAGVPYANRLRPQNGGWNPLPKGGGKKIPAWRRLSDFLAGIESPPWTREQAETWRHMLLAKCPALMPGFLDRPLPADVYPHSVFADDSMHSMARDEAIAWLMRNIKSEFRKSLEFPARCAEAGNAGQMAEPLVTAGTIHSVKGGEADTVILFPDLSAAAMRLLQGADGGTERDALTRLMYVGATRAKDRLFLMAPSGMGAFKWR